MYKNFAASIIAAIAVARGNRDGSSMENAAEIWLIPNLLKLESYNQFNLITMSDEFHGDLIVGVPPAEPSTPTKDGIEPPPPSPPTPVTYGMFVEYGFCARPKADDDDTPINNWDCVNIRTGVDPAKFTATSTYASDF